MNIAIEDKCAHLVKVFPQGQYIHAHVFSCAAKLHEPCFDLLPHALYSPDLVPNNYFLFLNIKKWLAGRRFISSEKVIAETNADFAELHKFQYKIY